MKRRTVVTGLGAAASDATFAAAAYCPITDRASCLSRNPFIIWSGGKASFTWAGYQAHVGARKKDTPAFDAVDVSAPENNEFGTGTTKARHFTTFSLRHATGNARAQLDGDLPGKLDLMNPMYFRKDAGDFIRWIGTVTGYRR